MAAPRVIGLIASLIALSPGGGPSQSAGGPACGSQGQERELLRSIEGHLPLPSEARLWGKPAVIGNLETFAAVPPAIAACSGGCASQGRSATRLFGVSGPVNRPGIFEVERGVTLRALLFEVVAGLRDQRALEGVRVAGRSDVVLGPESLEDSLESLGAFSVGSRGVIAIPDG